jgi:hypothetical protein
MKSSDVARKASSEEEFCLERKSNDFGRAFSNSATPVAFAFCCCCCWDIVGAYVGAYIGGTIGSGIFYWRLRHRERKLPKYRWILLFSFLSALLFTAFYIATIYWYEWADDLDPGWLRRITLGISDFGSGYFWIPFVSMIIVCAAAINPLICLIALKRFSWRFVLISTVSAVVGMVCGFAIGCAVLGGSIVLDWDWF